MVISTQTFAGEGVERESWVRTSPARALDAVNYDMASGSHPLADFLEALERAGELVRVSAEVDPALEIAAITERVAQGHGPALMFTRVRGHAPPVVTNLLASERRICRALGVTTLPEFSNRMSALVDPSEPETWLDRIKGAANLGSTIKAATKLVKTAPCQQVVKPGRDVQLKEWPALRSWSADSQATISSGQTFLCDRATGLRHVANPMIVVLDQTRLGCVWHRHQALERHFQAYAIAKERMPIAMVLGGDPIWPCLMSAPFPAGVDPCKLVACLLDRTVEMVKCRTQELEVPADADVVFEGHIDPEAPPQECGPLAGAGGYYTLPVNARVMHVTAITQRANPVFPATVLGVPPHEAGILATLMLRGMLPLVRHTIPELVDLALPSGTGRPGLVFASVRKSYPLQARKIANALWGLDALQFSKCLVLVDAEIDVQRTEVVMLEIDNHAHPGRDAFFSEGPADPLDHAAPTPHCGHRLGIDATQKLAEEHSGRWPKKLALPPELAQLVDRRWGEYGFGL